MTGLRSVEDHLAALLRGVEPGSPRRVRTPEALGLVLAEDVAAALDLPGFDNSAMDGYAVRSAECAAAAREGGSDESGSGAGCHGGVGGHGGVSGHGGVGGHGGEEIAFRLPVAADIAAGDTRALVLPPGHAARIMTGAPIPEGADAIVPVEQSDGGVETVVLRWAPEPGRHVRRRGEDVSAGQPLVSAGEVLTPGRIALLAAGNVADLLVYPRPRVTVLSTGDELIPLGEKPTHGQIIDSNQLMLAALVEAAGAEVAHVGRLADDPDAVRAAFLDPPGAPDLVLTSGGVSMGAHDTVKEVLTELGGVDFVKVAMRPGMPQGGGHVGRHQDIPIITLPGNPVSSFVSFHVFALPVLHRLAGRPSSEAEAVVGGAARRAAVAGASWRGVEGRVEFTRVHVCDGVAMPERGQGSHMLGALAAANALAVLPAPTFAVTEGDVLTIIPFVGEP